jgi:hypothetical protein
MKILACIIGVVALGTTLVAEARPSAKGSGEDKAAPTAPVGAELEELLDALEIRVNGLREKLESGFTAKAPVLASSVVRDVDSMLLELRDLVVRAQFNDEGDRRLVRRQLIDLRDQLAELRTLKSLAKLDLRNADARKAEPVKALREVVQALGDRILYVREVAGKSK